MEEKLNLKMTDWECLKEFGCLLGFVPGCQFHGTGRNLNRLSSSGGFMTGEIQDTLSRQDCCKPTATLSLQMLDQGYTSLRAVKKSPPSDTSQP